MITPTILALILYLIISLVTWRLRLYPYCFANLTGAIIIAAIVKEYYI
jgi:hypothetical protein